MKEKVTYKTTVRILYNETEDDSYEITHCGSNWELIREFVANATKQISFLEGQTISAIISTTRRI